MFSVFFFFGSLRVGPDSHKGPVARSGSNRWICGSTSLKVTDLRAPDPVLSGMKYLVKLARDHIAKTS